MNDYFFVYFSDSNLDKKYVNHHKNRKKYFPEVSKPE